MVTNFKIIDNIAIQDSDNYFDLHNNFELFKIEIINNELIIFFVKIQENWTKNELYDIIKISHKNVYYYSLNSFNKNFNKNSLISISFNPKNNSDLNIIFLRESPEKGDEIVYSFENDSYIKIFCDHISLLYK